MEGLADLQSKCLRDLDGLLEDLRRDSKLVIPKSVGSHYPNIKSVLGVRGTVVVNHPIINSFEVVPTRHIAFMSQGRNIPSGASGIVTTYIFDDVYALRLGEVTQGLMVRRARELIIDDSTGLFKAVAFTKKARGEEELDEGECLKIKRRTTRKSSRGYVSCQTDASYTPDGSLNSAIVYLFFTPSERFRNKPHEAVDIEVILSYKLQHRGLKLIFDGIKEPARDCADYTPLTDYERTKYGLSYEKRISLKRGGVYTMLTERFFKLITPTASPEREAETMFRSIANGANCPIERT